MSGRANRPRPSRKDIDIHVLEYHAKGSPLHDAGSKLVLDFKRDTADAEFDAFDLLRQKIQEYEHNLRDVRRCRYIMAIPSHQAGVGNEPCDLQIVLLAGAFPWLTAVPYALERTQTIRSAHKSWPNQRPSPEEHARTIQYVGPELEPHTGIILLDDVITRGATSQACRAVLRERLPNCGSIVGLFLARTKSSAK